MLITRRRLGLAAVLIPAALGLGGSLRTSRAGQDPAAIDTLLAGSVCSSAPDDDPGRVELRRVAVADPQALRYQGTHILTYGAMRELAERFNAGATAPLRVVGGGCDDALRAVSRDEAHLGGLCCAAVSTPARGWTHLRIAWDLKAVITHPSVPLADISLARLKAIATGGTRNWAELGAPRRPIALVLRQHCPDFREPVRQALLGHDNPGNWPTHPIFVDRDEQIVQTVARFEGAIGIVSLVFARPEIAAGRVRLLTLDHVRPDPAARLAQRYPLLGPLDLVMKRPSPGLAPFLRFAASPAGRAVLAREFIPVPLESALQAWPGRA